MLSKNQIKRIQSLARKKGRREEGCFIAEGNKLVEDTLSAFECDLILATPSWIVSHVHESLSKIQEVDEQEMSKVSPSNCNTVSTICSNTFGPAMLPSLLM